jgi:hypothetical protein
MTVENAVRAVAGTLVLASLALAYWLSPWALLLAGFVGLNLLQSAFTGFCPAEQIFVLLGLERGGSRGTPQEGTS